MPEEKRIILRAEMAKIITFKHKGNFSKTGRFFKSIFKRDYLKRLNTYAKIGVSALMAATPKQTGKTADSWSYEIVTTNDGVSIWWKNSNVLENGTPIVILLQYGHGTGNGGYVKGKNFINPAIKPVFDNISESVWKEVKSE